MIVTFPFFVVSIHTPTKGVTIPGNPQNNYIIVSIHTPTKGVTRRQLSTSIWRHCFNPHTHEGCDFRLPSGKEHYQVSIHTPTKGVTFLMFYNRGYRGVSIHTPTKGVTRCNSSQNHTIFCFNPHTHEGCDNKSSPTIIDKRGFNPHTHEGCDLKHQTNLPCKASFNPHTHEGCDRLLPSTCAGASVFQSTHPRRV